MIQQTITLPSSHHSMNSSKFQFYFRVFVFAMNITSSKNYHKNTINDYRAFFTGLTITVEEQPSRVTALTQNS
jgi:hypothetical protein